MLSISVIDYIRQQAFEQVELRSGQFGNWLQRWCLLVPSYGFTRWFLRAIIWIPFNTAEHRTYGKLEQWWLFESFKANNMVYSLCSGRKCGIFIWIDARCRSSKAKSQTWRHCQHGFEINLTCSLQPFHQISKCCLKLLPLTWKRRKRLKQLTFDSKVYFNFN